VDRSGTRTLDGYGAAVATPHNLATEAALTIIAQGGIAVDAAVAANAVLGVVAPETCGIGGDLMALVHKPGMSRPDVLNSSGRAGTGADPDKLRARGHRLMPAFDPHTVTVPGCVDGWEALLARYGTGELSSIVAPAIALATQGFPASVELVAALTRRPEHARQDAATALFPGGQPPVVGEQLRRPDLAATLGAVADNGRAGFYLGPAGKGIVRATEGVITFDDLERVQSEWTEPLGRDVFGLTGWTVPPNSQGYLTLASAAVYERLEAPDDPEDPRSWHLAIEAYRSMAVDRNDMVADPDYLSELPDSLLSDERVAERAALVDPGRAGRFSAPRPGPGGTAYLAVIDAQGLAVSFIQSIFMGLGSGLGAGEAGFFLHNRGAGFNLDPGHPNELGPGKRPLHTLSPSLWTRGDRIACLLGTRGGDYQPQLLLQVAVRCLKAGIGPWQAQAGPRWMVDPINDDSPVVAVEAGTPRRTVDELERLGHKVAVREDVQHGWGPVSLITIDDRGKRTAAADPRGATATAAVT
jgi:gamma-glutamyltranspeptidase/glutathione hydrolase